MTILFKKGYVEKITRGEKTSTRRPSRPMVRVGGAYGLRTGFFEYLPDSIRITRMFTQPLGEMTDEDASEEGSPSLEAFKEEWAGLYGAWDEGRRVWVVEFEYVGQI